MKAVIRRFETKNKAIDLEKSIVKQVIETDSKEHLTDDMFEFSINYRRYDGSVPRYIDMDVILQTANTNQLVVALSPNFISSIPYPQPEIQEAIFTAINEFAKQYLCVSGILHFKNVQLLTSDTSLSHLKVCTNFLLWFLQSDMIRFEDGDEVNMFAERGELQKRNEGA